MLLKVYKSRVWILLFMLLPIFSFAQPATWLPVVENPSSAVYAIQTTVVFDGVDALVAGDWIGVFHYNELSVLECAGYVEWNGTSNVGMVAFGNDTLAAPEKNGFSDGEYVNWVFYRSGAGEEQSVRAYQELDMNNEFYFANGDLDEVMVFGPDVLPEIQIPLYAEYQFVSSPIVTPDMNMLTVLTDVLGTIDFVRTNGNQEVYWSPFPPPGQWINQIGDWNNSDGYYFHNDLLTSTLVMTGEYCDPTTPIDLAAGYIFLGYRPSAPQDALVAFNDLLSDVGFIRTNGNKEIFWSPFPPPGQWINQIGDAQPGDGYYVQVNNPITGFVYPPADAASTSVTVPANMGKTGHFTPPSGGQPTDLWKIVMGECNINGVQVDPGDEIAVFDGANIVGLTVFDAFTPWATTVSSYVNLYTVGNTYTLKLWDESAGVETETYDVTLDAAGYVGTTFPPAGNPTSYATALNFTTAAPLAPVLLTADPGDELVDLTWEAIAIPTDVSTSVRTGHFTPPSGGQPTDLWKIVMGECNVNGVQVDPGDEIAVFDGANIVGLTVFDAFTPWATTVSSYVNLYTVGNTYTLKLWDESAGVETETYDVTLDAAGYVGTTFPPAGNPTSYATALNFTTVQPYVPTFNVYFDDGTLIAGPMEGLAYQVTGLENGNEYCFYVTQILEDLTESAPSNVLCALLPIICFDASISNWPADPEDQCVGENFTVDFSGVIVENAETTEWIVDPVEAGMMNGLLFELNAAYVGPVLITLNAYAFEPCLDATESLGFTVNPLPIVICPQSFAVCEDAAVIILADLGADPPGGTFYDLGGNPMTELNPAWGPLDYTFIYEFTDGNGCTNSCQFVITVNPLPLVTLGAFEPVCIGSDPFALYGGLPVDGTYFVEGTEMTEFNPEIAGIFIVEYVYTDDNGCTSSAFSQIMVNPLPVVTLMAYEPMCVGDP
nr:hypothetical protein [Bacteroidota bacterium]